ncbi:MAG TPA: YdbL family protein [Candidatus Deferrimicrobium sp.]|nr:YdbL family protein [Candidatus Deferrimicrobium sp.]
MERPAHRNSISVLVVLMFIAGCVTVNVYFPAAQVEKTAEKIVDEVYQEKKDSPPQEPTDKPRSSIDGETFRGIVRLARLGPAPAFAEEATTVSNAAIRGLKEQIGQRHQELLPYYQQGQVGITRDGFLEVRGTSGLGLPQVAALKRLVEADNAARRQLYEEVAKALNLKPDQVSQVRKIFAKQWREKAQAGWAVQTDDGQWGRK